MKRLAASIVLQVFFIGVVLGQLPEASFYHLERDKELLSSAFISCEQDDYGFIWFGSFYGGGLYRYDGYELKTFVIDPSRIESALTSNNINRIYAPGDDYLYVSTHGGWNKLNLVSGKFLPFAHTHTICPEEGAFYTTKILKDDFSRLWISSHYGLSSLDFPDADIRWLKPKGKNTSPAPEMLRDFIIDHINPNILWLASGQGLFRYDRSIDEYKHISANQIDIRMLAQDHSGKIWVTPSNSDIIFTFDPREEVWASHLIRDSLSEEEFILGLEILANNQIWITTENQVGIFDPLTKNYNAWQYDSNNPVGLLPQGNYYDVLNDRSGRLWIGSWYGVQYSR
ncbi:MAG: hypothetical protein HKN76_08335, partial [Saprospiraceae bacterium]|nr:hypothetical protein [Saprospiraceae bacterium]